MPVHPLLFCCCDTRQPPVECDCDLTAVHVEWTGSVVICGECGFQHDPAIMGDTSWSNDWTLTIDGGSADHTYDPDPCVDTATASGLTGDQFPSLGSACPADPPGQLIDPTDPLINVNAEANVRKPVLITDIFLGIQYWELFLTLPASFGGIASVYFRKYTGNCPTGTYFPAMDTETVDLPYGCQTHPGVGIQSLDWGTVVVS